MVEPASTSGAPPANRYDNALRSKSSRQGDDTWTRFFKYAYLLITVAVMSSIAYNAFSAYIARRDIDSELRSKKGGSSLEFLLQEGHRRRELALTSLDGRCTERMELALFRILDADKSGVDVAYNEMMRAKDEMVNLAASEGKDLIDPSAIEKMNFETFTPTDYEKYVKGVNDATETGDAYKKFRAKMDVLRDKYKAVAAKHRDLKTDFDQRAAKQGALGANFWSMEAVEHLAKLNAQMRAELKAQTEKLGEYEDVLSRYGVWMSALAGGSSASQPFDDTAYLAEKSNDDSLASAKCNEFRRYYEASLGAQPPAYDGSLGKRFWDLGWLEKLRRLPDAYDNNLLIFFKQPPSAQTLFVTILLGAIGATTLNMLRLSKVGWWNNEDDPRWGDIVVAPFLGALSAFAIFLVGSSGLLLTTDTSGNQPLSGYFIGLLGFLSGLVYDEAFGRVRRVGSQIFAANVDPSVVSARAEDRTLADLLSANGANLAASLVLLHGYGTALGAGAAFTLLAPSDEAMAKMPLGDWRRLNNLGDTFKQTFFDHRCADVALQSADAAAKPALKVKDGSSYAVATAGDAFTLGGALVIHRDLVWNKGVVHILAAEPTPS